MATTTSNVKIMATAKGASATVIRNLSTAMNGLANLDGCIGAGFKDDIRYLDELRERCIKIHNKSLGI